jgi:hypothetical protein
VQDLNSLAPLDETKSERPATSKMAEREKEAFSRSEVSCQQTHRPDEKKEIFS